jgi:transposase
MNPQSPPFDLAIGLDRSDRKIDLHLLDLLAGQDHAATVSTDPTALQAWATDLRQRFPNHRVAILFEQPANNLIAFLTRYQWITLYPINPISLMKFRESFVVSRAKDDSLDATFMAKLLAHHWQALRPWVPEDAVTRKLQRLVVDRRGVVDHRTGLGNRLQAYLKDYFPQALDLIGEDVFRPLATAFLKRWPTLQEARKATLQVLRNFYWTQGSRSQRLLEERLQVLQKAVPLTEDAGVLGSYVLRVRLTVQEIEQATRTVKHYDRQIATTFAAHPDHSLFANLPGAGPTFAARLLAALGTQRERYPDAASLQCACGIAPVTKQSGNKRHVHRRYRCSEFFKQSFHEWAAESRFFSAWARAFYDMKRAAGMGHHAAVRALAYKWIRILWRCWQDRTVYQEQHYLEALRKAGSPIIAWMEKHPPKVRPARKEKTPKGR